jgi:Alpha-tubulin suppressor and related RCC1 domain-containing proteins
MLHPVGTSPPLARAVAAALLVAAALGCRDDAQSPTDPQQPAALLLATTAALSFNEVSAGAFHTCGVTTDNRAYCWGGGAAVGDGTTTTQPRPVAVVGGLRFVQVSAGAGHTCGITTDTRAYCWGRNDFGQLGDGTTADRSTPVAVAGGRHFSQVRAGGSHTCALTPFNVPFCWGWNIRGQLGTNDGVDHHTPTRVFGGLQFRRIIAGGLHTCGAATDGRGYCWGDDVYGELGDGTVTLTRRLRPVAVSGDLNFVQVLAGGDGLFEDEQEHDPDNGHTCGVTTDNLAYCWGDNSDGQSGTGSLSVVLAKPALVAGGHHFRAVAPGNNYTCAVTPADVAWCWGENRFGAIGDGTTTNRPKPVKVAGGLSFSGLSTGVGGFHSCGLTTDHRAYCWGDNSSGELGDGTEGANTNRLTPVAVVGPS